MWMSVTSLTIGSRSRRVLPLVSCVSVSTPAPPASRLDVPGAIDGTTPGTPMFGLSGQRVLLMSPVP